MEFPFRDGKQFAGLSELPRQVEAPQLHWNMAMTAVSSRARLSLSRGDQRAGPPSLRMRKDEENAASTSFRGEDFEHLYAGSRQDRNVRGICLPICSRRRRLNLPDY
jgi:hypothetical protein